jgi:hypothetical protein
MTTEGTAHIPSPKDLLLLGGMSDRHIACLVLFYFSGDRPAVKEIAAILNMKHGTGKSNLHRARLTFLDALIKNRDRIHTMDETELKTAVAEFFTTINKVQRRTLQDILEHGSKSRDVVNEAFKHLLELDFTKELPQELQKPMRRLLASRPKEKPKSPSEQPSQA